VRGAALARAPAAEAKLRVETISSESDLARLGGSWDDLVAAMPRPSPFFLHAWLLEWWRHYGGEAELGIHLAYRSDRLVGALPLCTRRRLGLRVTEFVGGTWALLGDLLLAPGEDDTTAAMLVEQAAASGDDFASLFGLPGSSRLVAALPPRALHLIERLEAPVMDITAGWDDAYRAKLSAKARSERRRRLRQLGKLGPVEVTVARTRAELEPALEDAFRVHRLRWQGRRDASGFVSPTGLRFHRAAILALAGLGVPRLTVLRCGGQPIAFALALQLGGATYGVSMAFDPAYAGFGPGMEAKLSSLEAAAAEGVTRVELLGAAAPHKRRLTDRFEPIYQGIGLARTVRGHAASEALHGAIRARRRLKRWPAAKRLYDRVPRHVRGGAHRRAQPAR
jgi:CelD/BcsL family acetyltransferase involved in cellulose biosynthesis